MKVLAERFPGAIHYIIDGWKNVLTRCGYEWVWWPDGKSAFDVFDEEKPDIFIGATYNLTEALLKRIIDEEELVVILKGSNHGPALSYIDADKYPIINATETEYKKTVEATPNCIFSLYHPSRNAELMSDWENTSPHVLGLLPAADITKYKPVDPMEYLKCDVGFVGGYWGYKSKNIGPYIFPLLQPLGKYNVKIFGNQPWPVPQYLGTANDETINALFSSASICPNISEPHANKFGFEVNERVFKLSACGAFCISDMVFSLEDDIFTKHELVVADDPEHFHDLVKQFLDNPQLCIKHKVDCQRVVLESHTYHDRMIQLLTTLELPNADLVEKDKNELLLANFGDWSNGVSGSPCMQDIA